MLYNQSPQFWGAIKEHKNTEISYKVCTTCLVIHKTLLTQTSKIHLPEEKATGHWRVEGDGFKWCINAIDHLLQLGRFSYTVQFRH